MRPNRTLLNTTTVQTLVKRWAQEATLFTIGLIIMSYLFAIRFLVVRAPKEISLSWNSIYFTLYCALTLFFVALLINHVFPRKTQSAADKFISEREWLQKAILLPIHGIQKSLDTLHRKLITDNRISVRPILNNFIMWVGKVADEFGPFRTETLAYVHIVLVMIPRLAVTLGLAVDIIFFHKFMYTYTAMWLLAIPLLWSVFFYLIKKQWQSKYEWLL